MALRPNINFDRLQYQIDELNQYSGIFCSCGSTDFGVLVDNAKSNISVGEMSEVALTGMAALICTKCNNVIVNSGYTISEDGTLERLT